MVELRESQLVVSSLLNEAIQFKHQRANPFAMETICVIALRWPV